MTRIIPATVLFDEHGDGPPKLVVNQGGSDLGELITERGFEIQESGDFINEGPGLDPDNHGSEPPESLVDEPESKPRNGFTACMSEELRRPAESKPLTQPENRQRFREAVRACQIRRQEEDDHRDD